MPPRLVLVLAVLLACGGEVPEGSRDDFLGSWAVAGTVSVTVGSGSSATREQEPFEDRWVILPGEAADEIRVVVGSGCTLSARVWSVTASLLPGQKCARASAGATLAFHSGALSRNGDAASFSLRGQASVATEVGHVEGSFQMTGTMRRVP